MDWSEYFHAYMQMPESIRECALLSGSSVVATQYTDGFLSEETVGSLWQETTPKNSVIIHDAKYLYVRDIVEGQDGYSISFYQKVKSAGEEDPEEANVLFAARMDTLLWVGSFNNNQKSKVIPFVESIASHIYTHIVQSEE
ncbi:uncharacterized protein NEMAJ01_1345 [Nematocida major]|uniref:uncharacterized protein n=1 Tax=Nematocida major TaxID=1912982 RepID=UPI0020074E8C|nr:uncharacterized protein NEMAJ01_1345 [Nematocida major]KAH9386449.1 hypothetical protein NEMAJ01_1345 [Nematocida major]